MRNFPRQSDLGLHNTQWLAVVVCYTARRSCTYTTLFIMDPIEIKTLIENGLAGAEVNVFSEDNTHYSAIIISDAFADKRPIARHQLVYQCLGALMGNEIHAMSIRAHTPAEWQVLNEGDTA
jgi:acid stress-induced BolA-like protein IbaG/YrbA